MTLHAVEFEDWFDVFGKIDGIGSLQARETEKQERRCESVVFHDDRIMRRRICDAKFKVTPSALPRSSDEIELTHIQGSLLRLTFSAGDLESISG